MVHCTQLLVVNDSLGCSNRQQSVYEWTTTSFGYVHLVIDVIQTECGW